MIRLRFVQCLILFAFLFFVSDVLALNQVREITKKWDAVTVAPDTDWFGSDIKPSVTNPSRPVKHTLEFTCPTATIVNLQVVFNSITKVFTLNSGNALGASNGYQFSIILSPGMNYNIQHKTGTQSCAVVITESFNVDL